MSQRDSDGRDAFRPDDIDLSQLSVEQLRELKDAIVSRARERVGPEGFNPIMMATTHDGDLFGTTEDWVQDPRDWVILVARVIYALINVASRRVSLAVASSGAALAASHLYATEGGARFAGVGLLVAAVFGIWLVAELARPAPRTAARG